MAHRKAGTVQRLSRVGHEAPVLSPAPITWTGSRAASSCAGTARPWCMLSMGKRRGAEDRRPFGAVCWHIQVHHLDVFGPGEVYRHQQSASTGHSPQQEEGSRWLLAAGWHQRTVGIKAQAARMSAPANFSNTHAAGVTPLPPVSLSPASFFAVPGPVPEPSSTRGPQRSHGQPSRTQTYVTAAPRALHHRSPAARPIPRQSFW